MLRLTKPFDGVQIVCDKLWQFIDTIWKHFQDNKWYFKGLQFLKWKIKRWNKSIKKASCINICLPRFIYWKSLSKKSETDLENIKLFHNILQIEKSWASLSSHEYDRSEKISRFEKHFFEPEKSTWKVPRNFLGPKKFSGLLRNARQAAPPGYWSAERARRGLWENK